MLPTLQQKLKVMELSGTPAPTAEGRETPPSGCGDSTYCDSQTAQVYEQSDQLLAAALIDEQRSHSQEQQRTASGNNAEGERLACARTLAGTVGCNLLVPRFIVAAAAVDESAFADPPESLSALIRDVQSRDAFVQDIRRQDALRADTVPGTDAATPRKNHGEYRFDPEELLRHQGKVYIPRCAALREELLRRNHDDPVAGHYGRTLTQETLARKYSWPHLATDVRTYVEECDIC